MDTNKDTENYKPSAPTPADNNVISTKITDEDLTEVIKDEFGAEYSKDGKRLLGAPYDVLEYDIKEGTEIICDFAFSLRESLASITIPPSVNTIGDGSFSNCSSLTSITIPPSVTSIGDGAFEGCENLTSITIPSSVTTIGNGAFYGCSSLTSITIPTSVTAIGSGAFIDCENLDDATKSEIRRRFGDEVFD